jgi:hypothetical protein
MTDRPPPNAPRRWNVEVEGIRWLPRMTDKARMSANGTLGAYLLGHSPVDRALLVRLGLSTDEFAALAAGCEDDRAVLDALRRRGFDEARVRNWSDRFEATYRTYIHLWDVDEGYVAPSPVERVMLSAFRPVEGAVMAAARKFLPRP